jgi:deazaflavin-dependent oxidoreductase (nitroreductase family)
MPTKFGNAFMTAIIASPLHGLLGDGFAVITVSGRKTGRRISTPINVSPQNGGWVVISYHSRNWWKNLLDGRKGELRHRGKTFPVAARILEQTTAVAAELKKYFAQHPGRAKYFGIRPDMDGRGLDDAMNRAAQDRVVIFLSPTASG